MNLFDHPGSLGAARGSLLTAHHADWPAYPQGDDFRMPLLQLTAFPPGTEFMAIDHIDQSALLIACVRGAKLDKPFVARNFHIAVWYEDLIELDKRGFVDGVTRTSERGWHEDRWQRLLSEAPDGARLGYTGSGGEFVPIEKPDFESYSDDPVYDDFAICRSDRIKIMRSGRDFLLQELGAQKADIMAALGARITDLFERNYYDTCIREACVQLEHEIRLRTDSDAYGEKLAELFVERVRSEKSYLESHVRTFRQELRAAFKFIRNEFMHNLREVDSAATLAMLFRIASVRTLLATPPDPSRITQISQESTARRL